MFYLFKAFLVQIISHTFHLIPPFPNLSDCEYSQPSRIPLWEISGVWRGHARKGNWPLTLNMKNNDRWYFWALTECLTVWWGVLYVFTHLNFTTTHNNHQYCYYLNFVDEETEIQKVFMASKWQRWDLKPCLAPGAVCLRCIIPPLQSALS